MAYSRVPFYESVMSIIRCFEMSAEIFTRQITYSKVNCRTHLKNTYTVDIGHCSRKVETVQLGGSMRMFSV